MLNEHYQNIGLKGYFGRYGIVNALKRGVFLANRFHLINDYEIRKVLWQKRAANKVSKYLQFTNSDPKELVFGDCDVDNPIWIYWNSGMENAPIIVQKCYESILKYSNKEVILLTETNINDYIVFPDYIAQKVNNGQIPIAGYTDLMRFALLEHFGGTWMDSTILLTGDIPQEIMESDLFVFRNSLGLLDNPVLFPAWFIHAKKGNKIIRKVRNVAFAYWMKEKHVIEYLLPNLIMTQIIHQDLEVASSIPYMDSDYSERLIRIIDEQYTIEKASWIKKLTCIHKLTYKLNERVDKDGSIYRYIIEGKF